MLVGCTAVGGYWDWVLYSTASIYNVVDKIVIADGSPFGHYTEKYIDSLEELDIEGKIKVIEEDWKYPPHPYVKDLGLPVDEKSFSSGRVMTAACDEARKLGCDKILFYAPDHVFDESIKDVSKLTKYDSYRCHYYEMLNWDRVPDVMSYVEYMNKLDDPNFSSCIFLMPREGYFWGLEGSPMGVSAQHVVRFIWFGHYRDFSPFGWYRTQQYLYERGRYRAHIYNRAGKFDHFFSPEEEDTWVKNYVDGFLNTLKNCKTHEIGEPLGLPRPIRVVEDPYKYVKEGYPK